jgi:uncharacterized protein YecE (DUF72 family)
MTILVGTASWTDKSLIDSGKFYPSDATSAEDRLRYYAAQFPMVEVDSSYYAIPAPQTAQLWVERTPRDFIFNVKAFRALTGHQFDARVLPRDMQRAVGAKSGNLYYKDLAPELQTQLWHLFFAALEPLRHHDKLGAVHFQFAPWITSGGPPRKHVEHCVKMMESRGLMAIEFRNASWWTDRNRDSTLAFERERGLVNVVVDGPQGFGTSVPAVWEVTSAELAIVRLHGRNVETWAKKGLNRSSDRFNYDYADAELKDIAQSVETLAEKVPQTHVVLNNNHEDQGQRNARTLMRFLTQQAIPKGTPWH